MTDNKCPLCGLNTLGVGFPGPCVTETTEHLPLKFWPAVQALKDERDRYKAAYEKSAEGWRERVSFAVNGPHQECDECPTWYDGCNCGIVMRLESEIARLRSALAVSKDPCIYCQLPADEMAKCKSGFPGCGRADDMSGCPEFGAMLNEMQLREEVARLQAELAARDNAMKDIRDSVLHGRHQLAESGIDSDLTNAVLGIIDDNWQFDETELAAVKNRRFNWTYNGQGLWQCEDYWIRAKETGTFDYGKLGEEAMGGGEMCFLDARSIVELEILNSTRRSNP